MSSHWLVILRTFDPSFRQLSNNSKFSNEVKCKTCNNLRCWHDFAIQNVIILLINNCCSTEITVSSREDMDDSDPGPSESTKIVEYPDDDRGPFHGQHSSKEKKRGPKKKTRRQARFRKAAKAGTKSRGAEDVKRGQKRASEVASLEETLADLTNPFDEMSLDQKKQIALFLSKSRLKVSLSTLNLFKYTKPNSPTESNRSGPIDS